MRRYLGPLAIVFLLAGCGAGTDDPTVTSPGPWDDGMAPAASAGKVGGADTPCPLPVAIDLPGKWKPKPVETGVDNAGGLDLACEIDAKPAGTIGFVRVWIGTATDQRQSLEAFVAKQKASDTAYRDTDVGQAKGVEATWRSEDSGRKRAFAMSTPLKTVVVSVGGLDDEEYRGLLPAYLLAKQSLTPLEK